MAGVAAVLGIAALPFLPGKNSDLDPQMLFSIDHAKANKQLLRDLSLAFFNHPDPAIRRQCAFAMAILPGD